MLAPNKSLGRSAMQFTPLSEVIFGHPAVPVQDPYLEDPATDWAPIMNWSPIPSLPPVFLGIQFFRWA